MYSKTWLSVSRAFSGTTVKLNVGKPLMGSGVMVGRNAAIKLFNFLLTDCDGVSSLPMTAFATNCTIWLNVFVGKIST